MHRQLPCLRIETKGWWQFMCSYCGCHAIGPIRALAEEHVMIQNLMGETRRAALRGDDDAAIGLLRRLQSVLAEHDAVEELSLYPAMARHAEFRGHVEDLFDEHDDLAVLLERALTIADAQGACSVEWVRVLAGFDVLMEHIQAEENGLFPAAAISLDVLDWERAEQVRREFRAEHPPTRH